MVNNNQSVTINLKPESIRDIEFFVDAVCDQLFINDTYYGNILISVSELFNYLLENYPNENISIGYHSDYKNITISFHGVDYQVVTLFSEKFDFEDIMKKDGDRKLFLIHSLVDKISTKDDNMISLEFDISALHNEIYKKRSTLLAKYFSKHPVLEKVKREDD